MRCGKLSRALSAAQYTFIACKTHLFWTWRANYVHCVSLAYDKLVVRRMRCQAEVTRGDSLRAM